MGRHNDKNIREVLSEFVSSNERFANGYLSSGIEDVWKKEMGPVIAGYTTKVKFYEGVLKVYVKSAPLKHELLHGKEKIISIINEALGKPMIREVEIY